MIKCYKRNVKTNTTEEITTGEINRVICSTSSSFMEVINLMNRLIYGDMIQIGEYEYKCVKSAE